MIKIGSRELLASFPQLLIPGGEVAEISVKVFDWTVNFTIAFDNEATEQGVKAIPEGKDALRLVFQKWDNPLGSSLKEPGRIAQLAAGGHLDFLAANYRIGTMNVFSLHLLHAKEKA